MELQLRQLRYFVMLAEELHFGRAAERLAITQPPLSLNIQKLEEHLGTRLFDRDSHSVKITPVGKAFLIEARRVLAQAAHAEEATRALVEGRLGSLQVAFTTQMLYRGMPELLHAFGVRAPGVELNLVEIAVAEHADALHHGRVDVSFSNLVTPPRGLAWHRMPDDAFTCCVHASHWAARKKRLQLADLADDSFVLFARDMSAVGHEQVVQMCIATGFYPNIRHRARQWLSVVALVSQGFGIAIVPASIARSGLPNVRYIALDDPLRDLSGFVLWRHDHQSPTLESFVRHMRSPSDSRKSRRRDS